MPHQEGKLLCSGKLCRKNQISLVLPRLIIQHYHKMTFLCKSGNFKEESLNAVIASSIELNGGEPPDWSPLTIFFSNLCTLDKGANDLSKSGLTPFSIDDTGIVEEFNSQDD